MAREASPAIVIGRRILVVLGYIAATIIMLMMLLIVFDVIMRYIFSRPTTWISDFVTVYLNIWIVMLGSGYVLLNGGHVRIDVLTSQLKPKRQRTIKIFTDLLCLAYSVILIWQGWHLAESALGSTFPVAARLPMFPAKASILVGFLLLGIAFAIQLVDDLSSTSTQSKIDITMAVKISREIGAED